MAHSSGSQEKSKGLVSIEGLTAVLWSMCSYRKIEKSQFFREFPLIFHMVFIEVWREKYRYIHNHPHMSHIFENISDSSGVQHSLYVLLYSLTCSPPTKVPPRHLIEHCTKVSGLRMRTLKRQPSSNIFDLQKSPLAQGVRTIGFDLATCKRPPKLPHPGIIQSICKVKQAKHHLLHNS